MPEDLTEDGLCLACLGHDQATQSVHSCRQVIIVRRFFWIRVQVIPYGVPGNYPFAIRQCSIICH